MQNLQHKLIELLKTEDNLVIDGQLNKNKIIELGLKVETQIIRLLIKNPTFKKHFFTEVENVLVFDKIKFQRFVNNKSFLPDSYTAFKNKIGLAINDDTTDNFIKAKNDVVLAWPHKDCVLEGGQTKEDQKRNEIFWNETLAPDNVDRLLDAKAFTNFKKYDKDGEHNVTELKGDENLILKGNNLLVLSSLLKTHRGKIKLIYIDPPYNTGVDSFQYNDNFNHSTWLTFMKNRLLIARELLKDDGVIFVQCDDNEQAYLKVLMDEIFDRDNFLNQVSAKMKQTSGASGGGEDKRLKKNIEYLIIYSKNKLAFENFNPIYDEINLQTAIKEMRDEGKSWKYTRVIMSDLKDREFFKEIKDGSGEPIKIFKHSNIVYKTIKELMKSDNLTEEECYHKYYDKVFRDTNAQSSIRTRVMEATNKEGEFFSIDYIPVSGRNKNKLTTLYYKGNNCDLIAWLSDICVKRNKKLVKLEKLGTFWDGFPLNNLNKEGSVNFPNGKKPEALIKKILELTTSESDIVLDYHLGSGTSSAVAHKMKRKYIGIEQMNYNEDDSVQRLINVINADQSGISKDVNWQGGGSFAYAELLEFNQKYISQIQEAKTKEDVLKVWKEMEQKAFLSFQFNKDIFNERLDAFKTASLETMRQYLIEILDKNQLYVNFSEIEDETFIVSKEDKALNYSFYKANN
jgi:adenine-specific DNA-methyltransferase